MAISAHGDAIAADPDRVPEATVLWCIRSSELLLKRPEVVRQVRGRSRIRTVEDISDTGSRGGIEPQGGSDHDSITAERNR